MTASLDAPWRERAACITNPALFDLRLDDPETVTDRKCRFIAAGRICLRCPVSAACLADIDLDLDEGVRASHVADAGRLWPLVEWLRRADQLGGVAFPREHGTPRGYRQHRANGDMPACTPCLMANRADNNAYRARRKQVAS